MANIDFFFGAALFFKHRLFSCCPYLSLAIFIFAQAISARALPQERAQRERPGKRAEPEVPSRRKAGEPVCSTPGRRWLGGQQMSSRSNAFTRILEGENQVLPDPDMPPAKKNKKRSPCERCGRSPRQRVTCVGGCMRRVGPGCGQENVYLRCLLLEFPRLASRRSPHCRTGICVDCISQNPGGVMSSMRYTSSGAQSTGTLL